MDVEVNRIEEAEDQVRWKREANDRKTDSGGGSRRDGKAGSCVTRLKCISGVINKGEIHARLLRVATSDKGRFPPCGLQASALATLAVL